MEVKENNNLEYFEDELESDNLSFCNFSMQDNEESSVMQSPRSDSPGAEEFFEFSNTEMCPTVYSTSAIIFCGKNIIREDKDNKEPNEYKKRDYISTFRSKSFGRPFLNEEKLDGSITNARSSSSLGRFVSSQSGKYSSNYQIDQKVNITSLTSMSSKSRRRMFMFGPVKFKPEMELSALKERQGRRVPTPMFPAVPMVEGEKTVPSGAAGGKPRGKSHWGLVMRSFRVRSPITTVLAKSLCCTSPAAGIEKLIRVAN